MFLMKIGQKAVVFRALIGEFRQTVPKCLEALAEAVPEAFEEREHGARSMWL
jgi:hypothetical protein